MMLITKKDINILDFYIFLIVTLSGKKEKNRKRKKNKKPL